MKPADTAKKEFHVQNLPQHQLIPVQRQGELKYVWADAKDCRCLYVGNEANYQEFSKLAVEQRIAHENYEAAQANRAAAADWGVWDPAWGPVWWWW